MAEIDNLSPEQIEKIFRVVMLLKEEFLVSDESRYYTDAWIQAEREATEAYRRGGLEEYGDVDEMMDNCQRDVNLYEHPHYPAGV